MLTKQIGLWQAKFGKDYTDRNFQSLEEMEDMHRKIFGISRTELNEEMVGSLDRSIRILEVGCNIGNQLLCLKAMGFSNLFGIDVQLYPLSIKVEPKRELKSIQASSFELPFKMDSFGLILTSNVLIHISPFNIGRAMAEIFRCTRKYIWGFEYFAENYQKILYRGYDELAWKANFAGLWQMEFPQLKLVRERRLERLRDRTIDTMFLLEKNS